MKIRSLLLITCLVFVQSLPRLHAADPAPSPSPASTPAPYNAGFMKQAIAISETANTTPDTDPFGAVVVKDGKVVGKGLSAVRANLDPTAHGEVLAIRDAVKNLGRLDLSDCELYTSCEPCPMCVAVIDIARMRKVFYGTTMKESGVAFSILPPGGRFEVNVPVLIADQHATIDARSVPAEQQMGAEAFEVMKNWAIQRRDAVLKDSSQPSPIPQPSQETMKHHKALVLAAAVTLAPLASQAADAPAAVPDFLQPIVTSSVPPPTKEQLAFRAVYQLNNSMFNIYNNSLKIYQANIKARVPLIMALFTGAGGRFILYRPGEAPLEAPSVPPIYQATKSVGHCAMATYACVAPYIANPTADLSWIPLMKSYNLEIQMAKEGIKNLEIKPEEQALLQDSLAKILAFQDACLKNGTFTYAEVEAYARGIEPNIEKLVAIASAAQVGHWFKVMTEWKALLGKDWDKAYGLSNSIYVARQNNILFSVLVQFFGEKAMNDRLLLLETTDFQTTPEEMLTAFARITSDRVLGQVFFNNDRLMDYELLGFGGRAALEKEMADRGEKPSLPPLVPFNSTQWPMRIDPASGTGPKSFDDLHEMGLLKRP